MSEWISVKDQPPPNFKRVLVVKQYLDAPYGEDGYETEKAYWTPAIVMIDCFFHVWAEGGKGTHWMELPQLPESPQDSIGFCQFCDLTQEYCKACHRDFKELHNEEWQPVEPIRIGLEDI